MSRTRGRPQGLALLEALIAVLLLSMAALAYAALQMRGMTANTSSMWRSKATILAYEMADRMRANQGGVSGGHYNSLTSANAPNCGTASACSAGDMARLDYATWAQSLTNSLPGGQGAVCLDGTPDDGVVGSPACDGAAGMFAVKVFWREKGQDARLAVAVRP